MHSKDDETYQYLTYTKFTTTLTLFFSILLDGVINDILSDTYSSAKLDLCRMVIHQLKEEMKEGRQFDEARVEKLVGFLDSHDVFSLADSAHIQYIEGTTRTLEGDKKTANNPNESVSKNGFEPKNKKMQDFSEML